MGTTGLPFVGQVGSTAQTQSAVIGLSDGEVAARTLALRSAGLLPAALANMVNDRGQVQYYDANTGTTQLVRADFFSDFRPFVASYTLPVTPIQFGGAPSQYGGPVQPSVPVQQPYYGGSPYYPSGPPQAGAPSRGVGLPVVPVTVIPAARQINARYGAEFFPIVTGEPISTGVLTVISFVAGLFGGLFSGGVSAAMKRALEGLRTVITETADRLLRFSWLIANVLGRALQAFVKLWVRIIRPMLDALGKVIREVLRIYEKYARPVLRAIRRIRQEILYWYERVVRPILQALQVIRTVIYIFRVAGFKWAEEVDQKIVRLQAAIMKPLWYALEKLNIVSAWVNVILNVDGILRANVLFNSIDQIAGRLGRLLAWGGYVQINPARAFQLTQQRADWGVTQAAAAVAEYSTTNGGRLAPYAAEADALLQRSISGAV